MARVFTGEVSVYVEGTQFAEGPAFDAEGRLYITDGKSAALWRVERDGTLKVFARPKGPNGSAFHWNGDCYVTDPAGHRIARVTPDAQVYTVCDACDGQPVGTPNDLTFDPSGAIYFSSPMGPYNDPKCPARPVYRIGADGRVSIVLEGILYPNGVNVNADGTRLYVAESHTGNIFTCDVRPDGLLHGKTLLANVREGQDNWWAPDGMCLDVEGNLYVACYSGGRVRRIRPSGEIDLDILAPGPSTTNCCFGGKDNAELFITEGRDGKVYKAAIGIPGLALFGPRGWRNTPPA